MKNQTLSAVRASIVLFVFLAATGRADDLSDKGRDIFKQHQHAVVTVQVVRKSTGSGQTREDKQDLTGTVINPGGLAVIALSSCDPTEIYRKLYPDYKAEIEITDTKILLDDGTEIPAEIVLRDKDLDLAFIRPKTKPAAPMTAIDLGQSGPVDVLDQVVTLNRLKQAVGRAYSASVERVCAVVNKPRTFYIPDSALTETTAGSPAFSLNGKVVGIFVLRAVSMQGGSNIKDYVSTIILPAEDILKASTQAPEVKPDEAKTDAPKETKETNSPATGTPPK